MVIFLTRRCSYEIRILLEQSDNLETLYATVCSHVVLMGRFLITVSDTFNRLTKETENDLNESGFIGNLTALTYSYT